MTLFSNQLSGRLAARQGLVKIPQIYAVLAVSFLLLPLCLNVTWLSLTILMNMGLSMYLINSPIQLHFLGITEENYPQSTVLAASLHSIFCNVGIAMGSAIGGLLVTNVGLVSVGPGGAVFIVLTFGLVILLNRTNAQMASNGND